MEEQKKTREWKMTPARREAILRNLAKGRAVQEERRKKKPKKARPRRAAEPPPLDVVEVPLPGAHDADLIAELIVAVAARLRGTR